MKKKFLACILLPVVILFSCTKESSTIQGNEEAKMITFSANAQDWSSAANSSNPYDYVGIEHNKAAKHIVENISYHNLPNAQINYTTTKAYVAANSDNNTIENFNTKTSITLLADILNNFGSSLPTSATYTPILDRNTNLSAAAKNYLNNLINQMLNPNNTALTYNFYKSMIISWEGGINSLNISQNDKKTLYMSASIIRYSLLLWKDLEYPDFGNERLQLIPFKIRLFGWIATALADGVVFAGASSILTPVGGACLAGAASAGVAAVCGINNW